MQISRYLKCYPCPDNPEQVLLFSTKTLAKVLVPLSVLRAMEENDVPPKICETLSRLGILVSDVEEERRQILHALDEINTRSTEAKLTAVMNLDCNLACSYCYEGGHRGSHYMSPVTADLLVRYAEDAFLRHDKDVSISFYGGEPLLSLDLIRDISRKLKSSAESRGNKYAFSLVTNGTLLTPQVVRDLAPLGLLGARVTLDGPPENHDTYRPFVSGKGSFDVIVENLLNIEDPIFKGITGNYTKDNYRDFPRLLDVLSARGLTPEKISHIMFAPIAKTLGKHYIPEFSEGCSSLDEPWQAEAGIFLREEILRRGYPTPKVIPTVCAIELRDSLIINYDGTLYKCPALMGVEDFDVGHLRTGVLDHRDSHNLDAWKKDECLDCPYLPLCFGGCRLLRLLQTGNLDDVECRAEWLDATLETFVRQDLRYLSAK